MYYDLTSLPDEAGQAQFKRLVVPPKIPELYPGLKLFKGGTIFSGLRYTPTMFILSTVLH